MTPEQRISQIRPQSPFGFATTRVQNANPGYVVSRNCIPDRVLNGGDHYDNAKVIDVVKEVQRSFVQLTFQVEGVNMVELQGYTLARITYSHRAVSASSAIDPRHVAAQIPDWTHEQLSAASHQGAPG